MNLDLLLTGKPLVAFRAFGRLLLLDLILVFLGVVLQHVFLQVTGQQTAPLDTWNKNITVTMKQVSKK